MSAIISKCGQYRYRLERHIAQFGPTALIIGVNPSTADATIDDHTIRKEIGFAKRLGWGRLLKANLFAYRATDIKALSLCEDPLGPHNDKHVEAMIKQADMCIGAWGTMGKLAPRLRGRSVEILNLCQQLGKPIWCFGVTKDQQPKHTLMLGYNTPLVPYDFCMTSVHQASR